MKRDLALIRCLLLSAEAEEKLEATTDYSEKQVLYHCELAIEAGLLEGQVFHNEQGQPFSAVVQRLTWAGHDFLDAARSETNWKEATDQIEKAGGSWTFEIVKSLLVEIAKQALLPG